ATSRFSRGPNRLLKDGAKLTEAVEDILEEIPALRHKAALTLYKEEGREAGFSLSRDESAVLNALHDEPIHIDRLFSQFQLSPGAFSKVLLDLELKGRIKSLPGKIYARI